MGGGGTPAHGLRTIATQAFEFKFDFEFGTQGNRGQEFGSQIATDSRGAGESLNQWEASWSDDEYLEPPFGRRDVANVTSRS